MDIIKNSNLYMSEFIAQNFFVFDILEIFFVLLIFLLSIFLRKIFASFLINKMRIFLTKLTRDTENLDLKPLFGPLNFLSVLIGFMVLTFYLNDDPKFWVYLEKINRSLLTVFIFWFLHQAIYPLNFLFLHYEKLISKALTLWLIKTLKFIIILLGIAAVLDVWGIKIGPIIAGLGLFGVAVALGAQDTFKNLISGILILLEKSFELGDVINVPGHAEGTVEYIGFRSTKIRMFDSTPISIPNYIFAEVPIINFSQRQHRRVNMVIGLEYSSTLDQIKKIISDINSEINQNSNFVVNDTFQSYIRLEKFNDSSIDILVKCFTLTKDYDEFLRIKEDLALKIKKIVEKNDASFAFPSQTIYLEKKI